MIHCQDAINKLMLAEGTNQSWICGAPLCTFWVFLYTACTVANNNQGMIYKDCFLPTIVAAVLLSDTILILSPDVHSREN